MEGPPDTRPEEGAVEDDIRQEARQGLHSDQMGLDDPVDQEVQDSHPDIRRDIHREDLQDIADAKVEKDATTRKVDDRNVKTNPTGRRATDSSARTEAEAEVVNATAATPEALAVAASEEARKVPTPVIQRGLQAVDRQVHAEESPQHRLHRKRKPKRRSSNLL